MIYSSTTINGASKHCAKWLDHAAARVPYDRDVFQAGTVAHSILQAVANYRADNPEDMEPPHVEIAQTTMQRLLGKGRKYRGHTEPPPQVDVAWAGYEIAMGYLRENMIPVGLPEVEVRGEVGGFKVAAILDLVSTDYDFDSGDTLLRVTDYKSSWAATADELDSIQRKMQAILAWENRAGLAAELGPIIPFDGLRLEVVNLRTGIPYTRDLPAGEVLDEYLSEWREQIAVTIRGLEDAVQEDGTRRANPGPRCMGCPYVLACDAAGEYITRAAKLVKDKEAGADAAMAGAYAVAAASKDDLAKYLRHATAEQPIAVPGGEVGYRATSKTVAADGYAEKVAGKWKDRGGEIVGLLEAASLTGYSMKSIARALWPGRDKESIQRRQRWLATVTTAKAGREFKAWKE